MRRCDGNLVRDIEITICKLLVRWAPVESLVSYLVEKKCFFNSNIMSVLKLNSMMAQNNSIEKYLIELDLQKTEKFCL